MRTETTPPMRIEDPAAWTAADFENDRPAWLTRLSEEELEELEAAGRTYLASGKDLGEIDAAAFPLPRMKERLAALRQTLIDGIGFEVIRGLPVKTWPKALSATVYCGIGAHLGSARSQNAQGHLLGHVTDTGADPKNANTRIYQTRAGQTFHTDSADVVGLLCLQNAKEGGDSLVVSTVSIHNEMMKRDPELTRLLHGPIATDRRGETPPGEKPYFTIPVFNWHEDRLTGVYQRPYIESAQRFDDAPRLTDAHIAAFDLFDEISTAPEMHIRMRLEPGDIQFVYNHALLHDRTPFVDWPDPAERRHLLRLWLAIPGDRTLPEVFRQRYGPIEVGDRGGIICEGTTLNASLDF